MCRICVEIVYFFACPVSMCNLWTRKASLVTMITECVLVGKGHRPVSREVCKSTANTPHVRSVKVMSMSVVEGPVHLMI